MEKAFTGDLPRQNVDGGQALAEQLSRCEALHSPRATRCRTCVFRRPGIHLGVRKESPGGLARSHCCCMHSFESTHTPCMHRINVRGKPCMHGVNERDATRHGTHLHEADRAIPTVYNSVRTCSHLTSATLVRASPMRQRGAGKCCTLPTLSICNCGTHPDDCATACRHTCCEFTRHMAFVKVGIHACVSESMSSTHA